MTIYAVAVGHDVADINLIALDPQPACQGIQATVRTYSGSGKPDEQGLYCEFVYGSLTSAAEYRALLAQFGLDGREDAVDVTVRTRDHKYNDVRVNGTAIFPEHGTDTRYNYFPRTVILVRDVKVLP